MKKIMLTALCAFFSLLAVAQNMRTERDSLPRSTAEYYAMKVEQPKLVLLVGWQDEDNALYAAPDPKNPGEILLFYRAENWHYDKIEIYFVFDKEGCRALRNSLEETLRVLKKWEATAIRNKIDLFQKEMDIAYPEVNIYWRRTRPRFRKVTYSPLFMWAGKAEWLKPEFHFTKTIGSVYFQFSLHDYRAGEDGVGQPIKVKAFRFDIKDYLKWLDYDKLKRIYIEKTPDRSKWDELFQ